jgi:hypothetical protein
MDSLGVCLRTLFFKHSKTRDPNLMVGDSSKLDMKDLPQRLLSAFQKMMKE